jgi:hypothetical protein
MQDPYAGPSRLGMTGAGRRLTSELEFLIGRWISSRDGSSGVAGCQRVFEPVLNDTCVRMLATWELGGQRYEEHAYLTRDAAGRLQWWSFASDGRHTFGSEDDVSDIDPRAVGFSSRLSDGAARQAWWQADDDSLHWVVEVQTGARWRRLLQHRYVACGDRSAAPPRGHAGPAC